MNKRADSVRRAGGDCTNNPPEGGKASERANEKLIEGRLGGGASGRRNVKKIILLSGRWYNDEVGSQTPATRQALGNEHSVLRLASELEDSCYILAKLGAETIYGCLSILPPRDDYLWRAATAGHRRFELLLLLFTITPRLKYPISHQFGHSMLGQCWQDVTRLILAHKHKLKQTGHLRTGRLLTFTRWRPVPQHSQCC